MKKEYTKKTKQLEFVNVIIPQTAIVAISEKCYLVEIDEDEFVWISKKYVNPLMDDLIQHISLGIVHDWDYSEIYEEEQSVISGDTFIKRLLAIYGRYNHTLVKEYRKGKPL